MEDNQSSAPHDGGVIESAANEILESRKDSACKKPEELTSIPPVLLLSFFAPVF